MNTLEIEKSVTFKNILVATDFSDASRHAVEWAAAVITISTTQSFSCCTCSIQTTSAGTPGSFAAESRSGNLFKRRHNFEKVVAYGPLGRVHHEEDP